MSLAKSTEQNSSKKVDNDKIVRILVIKDRKIIITTASAILASKKLLTVLTKVILPKGEQDVRVKKVWIKIIG